MPNEELSRNNLPWLKREDQIIKSGFNSDLTVKEIHQKFFLYSRSLVAVQRRVITLRLKRSKRIGLQALREDARKVGLTLLSKRYHGVFRTYQYKCKVCGKVQPKNADQIRYHLSKCTRCMDAFVTLKDAKALAKSLGGKCLSKEYLPHPRRMIWKCGAGHAEFKRTYAKVKQNQWCPDCRPFVGERVVRAHIEQLTGYKFPKVRGLPWLSPNGKKHQLELDGYCKELNSAFELWGRQHYMANQFYHKKKKFSEIQRTDFYKMFACYSNRTKLLIIPELGSDLNWSELKPYLIKLIRKNRLPINKKAETLNIDLSKVLSSRDQTLVTQAKKIIKANNGKLLDELPSNKKVSFRIQCGSNHKPFLTTLHNLVERDFWCRKCSAINAGKKRRTTLREINNKTRKKGFICITPTTQIEPGPMAELQFKCLKNKTHLFNGLYSNYVSRKNANCPHCSKNRRWTVDLAGQELAQFKIRVVKFNGTSKVSDFKCAKNHLIKSKWRNLLKKIRRSTPLCEKCG